VDTIRFRVPQDNTIPTAISNLQLYASFQTVMFVFDNSEDLDIATYEYRLYEEDQVEPDPANPGYYKLINAATINSGSVVPYSQGFNTANVFTVAVENSTTTSTSNVTSPVSYYGAARAIDTSANASGWTLIGKTSTDTPLIDEQFIGSLTAAKITAGTIGAHTITLSGANSIIKSSIYNATTGWQIDGLGNATFNTATLRGEFSSGTSPNWFRVDNLGQIWSGADTYANAISKFRVSNTGSLNATTGKIGPVNITSINMNSQGSSPFLNPNNNYYRFDQFGDITVFSNPGSDVAPGGAHLNQFHRTNIVGEYISIGKHSDSNFNTNPTILAAFMGNSTGSIMEFSLTEGSVNKFLVKTDGTLTTSTSVSSPSITGTTSVSSPFVNATIKAQVGFNLNIGNNPSAGPNYVNSTAIEIQTDTNFGGAFDGHTGYAIYSVMPGGWGTAELQFQCSNNWGSYAYNPVAFTIAQSTVTASGYAYFSDRRLKENIVDCNFGLKEILKLNPKNYNLIQDSLIKPINENDPAVQVKTRTGLIAQEVLDVIPSIVSGGENQSYYSLDYNMLIPVLVNAIKELTTKVDELESRLI
jgi:hypothetical protein